MFDSAIIEVAICLVLTYLLLSLICSTLNELIATALGLRAKNLEEGIANLLAEGKAGDAFVAAFYGHPLINSLSKAAPKSRPSYISAELFTKTALHLVSTATGAAADATISWTSIQQGANSLAAQGNPLGKALQPLLADAANDLDKLRQGIEHWYDDTMDRVSGWYKRKTQVILLVLAILVSVAVDADTVAIGRQFFHDVPLRQTMIGAARNLGAPGATEDQKAQLQALVGTLDGLRLPLGWDVDRFKQQHCTSTPQGGQTTYTDCHVIRGSLEKLSGWTVTVLALSLGAPFWYDALSALVRMRGCGPRPERKSDGNKGAGV